MLNRHKAYMAHVIYHPIFKPARWVAKNVFGISSTKRLHDKMSRNGSTSSNEWIRKSATIEGWMFEGEHEFLWQMATRGNRGDILEIGSWMGKSACIFSGACKTHAPGTKVLCVDTFSMDGTAQQIGFHGKLMGKQSGTFYYFLANARRLEFDDTILPFANYSNRIIPYIKADLRLAFIDGAHDYVNAKRDFELCFPLVHLGGVVVFHDVIGPAYPELTQYFERELKTHPKLNFLGSVQSTVAFEKISD